MRTLVLSIALMRNGVYLNDWVVYVYGLPLKWNLELNYCWLFFLTEIEGSMDGCGYSKCIFNLFWIYFFSFNSKDIDIKKLIQLKLKKFVCCGQCTFSCWVEAAALYNCFFFFWSVKNCIIQLEIMSEILILFRDKVSAHNN